MRSAFDDQAVAGLPQDVQDGLRSLANRTKALWALPFLHLLTVLLLFCYMGWLIDLRAYGLYNQYEVMAIVYSFFPWFFAGEDMLLLIVCILDVALFGMWIYRANSNLQYLAVKQIKNTPADAAYWQAVDVAYFWMPYVAAREVWRGSDPSFPAGFDVRDAPSSVAQKWWLIAFLISFFLICILFILCVGNEIESQINRLEPFQIPDLVFIIIIILTVIMGIIGYCGLLSSSRTILARQIKRAKMVFKTAPKWASKKSLGVIHLFQGLNVIHRRKKQIYITGIIIIVLAAMQVGYTLTCSELSMSFNKADPFYWPDSTYMKVVLAGDPFEWLIVSSYLPLYFFIMWCYCVHRNLQSLRVTGIRHTPLRAFLWWFIPLFNIVGIARVLDEIWRGSDQKLDMDGDISTSSGSWLVIITMAIFALISLKTPALIILIEFMDPQNITEAWILAAGKNYLVLDRVLLVLFLVCIITLTVKITNRQMARSTKIYGNDVLPAKVFARMQRKSTNVSTGDK